MTTEHGLFSLFASDEEDGVSPAKVQASLSAINLRTTNGNNNDDDDDMDNSVVYIKTEYKLASGGLDEHGNSTDVVMRPAKRQNIGEKLSGRVAGNPSCSDEPAQISTPQQLQSKRSTLRVPWRTLLNPFHTMESSYPSQHPEPAGTSQDAAANPEPQLDTELSAINAAAVTVQTQTRPGPLRIVRKTSPNPLRNNSSFPTPNQVSLQTAANNDVDVTAVSFNMPFRQDTTEEAVVVNSKGKVTSLNDDTEESDEDYADDSVDDSTISTSNSDQTNTGSVHAQELSVEDGIRLSRPRRAARAPTRYSDKSLLRNSSVDFDDENGSVKSRSSQTDGESDHDRQDNRVPLIVVDHLSKLSIDPETKLPTKTFTCHHPSAGKISKKALFKVVSCLTHVQLQNWVCQKCCSISASMYANLSFQTVAMVRF
jgi:hypothetical protein